MTPMTLTTPTTSRLARILPLALAVSLFAGCAALGPRDRQPPQLVEVSDMPSAFKQGQGSWVRADRADVLARGPWWRLFDDPVLSGLAEQVEVNNLSIAAAGAAYRQARALTAEQRASLFPVVSLDVSNNRSGAGGGGGTRTSYQVGIGTAWEPDLFGRLDLGIRGAEAAEQASAADLAAARLAVQGELALNYFGVRETDILRALTRQNIDGYERTLQIIRNRYEAGIVARTDVLQAETQLANARADLLGLDRQRGQFEHAIAVLIGRAPANFSLPPESSWRPVVPAIPVDVPSTLLLRRPDIVAAERRVAQAITRVGVAQAAYYPSFRLSASLGLGAASIGDLFSASSLVWALGSSLAQTIFNAGATGIRVEGARAAVEDSAARYRHAVLLAFEDVENQLLAARILGEQAALREQAARSATLVEQQAMNRYRSGLANFTEVVTAQVSAANARRTLAQLEVDRQLVAVALIQALGGGWTGLSAPD